MQKHIDNKQIKRYYSFSDYLKQTFGEKVYKLSLDIGLTCPNRDGTKGTRGCIFCSEGGSGDFAEKCDLDINKAIENAKSRIKQKTDATKFIAYFQSYTNTYGKTEYLEKVFTQAIKRDDIVAISIATRPDCLEDDKINLIKNLCKIKPVFIELGLQTIHEETARFIRRAYPLSTFDEAIEKLKETGAKTVVHLILGLPYESEEMMLESVKYVANKNVDGIKLQLLHVLKNTDLAQLYLNENFKTLSQEEYINLLAKCIEVLPKNTVVHRLTGDAPKKILLAPQWSANKKQVLNAITKYFNLYDVMQGKNFNP